MMALFASFLKKNSYYRTQGFFTIQLEIKMCLRNSLKGKREKKFHVSITFFLSLLFGCMDMDIYGTVFVVEVHTTNFIVWWCYSQERGKSELKHHKAFPFSRVHYCKSPPVRKKRMKTQIIRDIRLWDRTQEYVKMLFLYFCKSSFLKPTFLENI